MKIRNSFVSNSSSSSFIIAVKKGKALNEDVLMKAFKVPKGTPLYDIAYEMADILVKSGEPMTLKEYMEDQSIEEMSELQDGVKEAFDKGKVYCGSVSDDGTEPAEAMLCMIDLDYEDENIYISKEGGY